MYDTDTDFLIVVGEYIDLHIRCDTTYDFTNVQALLEENKTQMLRDAIKTTPLALQKLDETEKNIHIILRCSGKFAYLNFFKKNGIIVIITKTLFSIGSHLRLSVLFDSSIENDIKEDRGNIYKMTHFIFSVRSLNRKIKQSITVSLF